MCHAYILNNCMIKGNIVRCNWVDPPLHAMIGSKVSLTRGEVTTLN